LPSLLTSLFKTNWTRLAMIVACGVLTATFYNSEV